MRKSYADSETITEECYCRFAHELGPMQRKTQDELLQCSRHLQEKLKKGAQGGIFSLLAECAEQILCYEGSEPRCRLEHMLKWRELTLALGQDIFTCAGLAQKDARDICASWHFQWPPVILTNHVEVSHMLERGMSENHYHLNGSTQIFSLAWSFLMNHPQEAQRYFDDVRFQEDLDPTLSYGEQNNRISWRQRIYDAAWIRAKLFEVVRGLDGDLLQEYRDFSERFDQQRELFALIERLRLMNSARFHQRRGFAKCLDYAITPDVLQHNAPTSPVRLLAGERYFLYKCFYCCFCNSFTKAERDLFYLYLCLKARFRSELVQVNGRMGFRNFSDYQDRKDAVWGDWEEYWEEAYRLSAAASFEKHQNGKQALRSLELRVMPKNDAKQLKRSIDRIDQCIEFALEEMRRPVFKTKKTILPLQSRDSQRRRKHVQENAEYFYVLHFAKEQLKPAESSELGFLPPRNAKVRSRVRKQARATARALERSNYLCSRIRGIDACSHEIGCRPETFATAFRYLRTFCPQTPHAFFFRRYWPRIAATYHVGEDFLDIADGLRAIDEAVCFLNLERGDRIGHALALGTLPSQYYRVKENQVALPAQDLLDNLVWLLFRSQEWDVEIPASKRTEYELRANRLLRRIYGDHCKEMVHTSGGIQIDRYDFNLADYYDSWKLRGDDPYLYWVAVTNENKQEFTRWIGQNRLPLHGQYQRAMLDNHIWEFTDIERDTSGDWGDMRNSRKLQLLLHRYHFGVQERLIGQKIEFFNTDPEYICVMEKMQNKMMEKLMLKGIKIECNPSSNHLIGTFDRYEQHPIFRFNHFGLPESIYSEQKYQLDVSINTDDQGVFDTSLENEYALLWACLLLRRDGEGRRMIDNDSIAIYLNHLRELGNDMVFSKATKLTQQRSHR